jgi:pimeloyl-ACP methyl ester carboxylesterase
MAEQLAALGPMGTAAGEIASLADLPLAVISAGDQPPDVIAQHNVLARLSSRGRHLVATKSSHWIHLDEPELVVTTIREVMGDARA